MGTIRNSVLLPDELYLALKRFLGYQKDLNEARSTRNPCERLSRRTFPISDDDSFDPCPTVCRFPMPRNSVEPFQDPLYRHTLDGSRQNQPMTEDVLPSCSNKDDEYQCCNLQDCPNNSPPLQVTNDTTSIPIPLSSLLHFQSLVNPSQHSRRNVQRSQSVPRQNDKSSHHNTTHDHAAKRIKPTTPCELSVPSGNRCPADQIYNHDMDTSCRNSTSYGWNECSDVGINYGEFQRRQLLLQKIQQQQYQQQQARQQNQSNISWLEDDDSIVFEPDLNSTRISRDDRHQQSRLQPKPNCQMCNSRQQKSKVTRSTLECDEPPEMIRHQTQYKTNVNDTSYLQPPETLRNARCGPQRNQSLKNSQDIYRDACMNQTPSCQQSMSKSLKSSSDTPKSQYGCCRRGRSMDGTCCSTSATKNQTSLEKSQMFLGRSSLNQTSFEKTKRNTSLGGRSMRMGIKTPEDRLVERIQSEFHETLVKDRFCPGIIQASLDGREDFNEYSRVIAFAGPVPEKPYPLDPITMIEAIKLRIDHERMEIRKKKDLNEERNRDLRNESKEGRSRRPRPIIIEDIDIHFNPKNKSEVNEGVAAFLRAETEYQKTSMGRDSAFDAHINRFEGNLFDEKIKVHSYTATTTPAYR